MSNVKFILLPGALPPERPNGALPLYPAGGISAPRLLTCVGAFGPHSHLLSKYHRLLQILLTALTTGHQMKQAVTKFTSILQLMLNMLE